MDNKKLRIMLGIFMFYSFICLAFTLEFLLRASMIYRNIFIVFLAGFYLWMPSVMLIGLTYVLLTKVFKYKEVEKEDE